jgi:hypothetical protein
MAATLAGQAASIVTITADNAANVAALALRVRVDAAQAFNPTQQAQARANAPPFESGTKMIFWQSSAPTGWTKDVANNDKALRITSGAASSGGSVDFSTLFARTATDAVTLVQANLPNVNFVVTIPAGEGSHTHTGTCPFDAGNQTAAGADSVKADAGSSAITINAATLPQMAGTAASGGSGTSFSPAIDMRVKYVDVILATKD